MLGFCRCTDKEKYNYRLVGVVEHLGGMRGGHYVAYVRGAKLEGKTQKENEGCLWYHASDVYVRESSLEEVLGCEAYILFYEQVWNNFLVICILLCDLPTKGKRGRKTKNQRWVYNYNHTNFFDTYRVSRCIS